MLEEEEENVCCVHGVTTGMPHLDKFQKWTF